MIRSKIPNVGTTVFTEMTSAAEKYGAVNLSQGFPEFDIPRELIRLTEKYMRKGYNRYAPMPGVAELRQAISDKVLNLYGFEYDPDDEITITAGGTQALYSVISASVHEGDQVIIFEPAYDSYAPAVRLNGGQPIYVEMKTPDYKIDWQEVNKQISSKTKLIIINSPHNPTGKVFNEQDMQSLSKLVSGTKIMILSDEVYEHIIFNGKEHQSVCRYPGLAERSFVVFSFGKLYHATGWKIGYCLAPAKLSKEFRKLHQFMVFSVNTPVQYALSDMLNDDKYYRELSPFFEKRRDFFVDLLKETGFEVSPAEGSYFQIVDFSKYTKLRAFELAMFLTEKYKIAGVPLSAFYRDKPKSALMRFCFAKEDATLKSAASKLADFIKDHDS